MISGGNATIYVSNMDAAVRFYTEVLGLRLSNRFGDNWATVEAGPTLTIGLHPTSAQNPAPGTKGSVMLGLEVDEPIERVVARLAEKGVRMTGEIIRQEHVGNFAAIEDLDGNPIYLWEVAAHDVPVADTALTGSATR
jgi:catechol 2,3-dioxygenase